MKLLTSKHKGLGITELLLCLAIIGIIGATAAPYVRAVYRRQVLGRATIALTNECDRLVTESTVQQETIKLVLAPHSYDIAYASGPKAGTTIHATQLAAPLSVVLRGAPSQTILFYPSGVTSPGRVELTDGQNTCHVIIALRGRVHFVCNN